MKMILSTIATVLFLSANALGCLPPPPNTPAFQIQSHWLVKIVTDPIVAAKVMALGGLGGTVDSINMSSGYQITMTNGCSFKVITDDSNASPGTCPELLPLKVSNEHCP